MSVLTPLQLLAAQKKAQAEQAQMPKHPLDLTPTMLESLGKLAGVSLRRDEISNITQVQEWWQDKLQTLAHMAREIFYFSRTNAAEGPQPIWLHLGLSLCQLFLDYVDQLPVHLQKILADIESHHVQLTDHLEYVQSKHAGDHLVKLLEGFCAIAELFPDTSTPSADAKPLSIPSLPALLSDLSLKKLAADVKLLKPVLLKPQRIPGIDKMIKAIERFIQKRLDKPLLFFGNIEDKTNPNSGEVEKNHPNYEVRSRLDPYYLTTVGVFTLDFSYRVAKMVSDYIREMTDVVILLTYFSDLLGRCTGTLLQSYQNVWYEVIQSSGASWDKKSAELELVDSLRDDPELISALTGSFAIEQSSGAWMSAQRLNDMIQTRRERFLSVLDELSANWNADAMNSLLETVKDHLTTVPTVVTSAWIQSAWEDVDQLQDQVCLLTDALTELKTSIEK